jgi:hypothetical protein
LAGYESDLVVARLDSEDERAFLEADAFQELRERRVIEQVLTQLLSRKVRITERTEQ